jgi:hypothetical protein
MKSMPAWTGSIDQDFWFVCETDADAVSQTSSKVSVIFMKN